jgi:hypothetical protein
MTGVPPFSTNGWGLGCYSAGLGFRFSAPSRCSPWFEPLGRTRPAAGASSKKAKETGMRDLCGAGKFLIVLGTGLFVYLIFGQARQATAIPAFARKYRTACSTCHSDFPELNDFGWAFYKRGFKFPKNDAEFVKQPQQMLGAPIDKTLFPKVIYPGEIPGSVPLGFRYEGYAQYNSKQPLALGFLPRVNLFAPDTFTALTAGSFGPNLSWWVDDDISVGGQNAAGSLGFAYLKANDIGRYLHLPKDALNVQFGQFELDLPFSQAYSINPTDYDIYDELPVAGRLGTTNDPFCLCAMQRGVQFGGYPNDGDFNWSVAITNGSNDGLPGSNGKNVYVNVFNQFNLERNPQVRKAVQASGPTGPHDHTSIRLGSFYDYGQNAMNTDPTLPGYLPGFPAIDEPYYKVGSYFRFKYQSKFELYALGMFSHDANLIPAALPSGNALLHGPSINYSGGFAQAEYWVYPWLIPLMRFDLVNAPFDFANGLSTGFARDRFSPGVQVLVRANIKMNFEYEHRWGVPVRGALPAYYHPNGFLLGMDFAY